VDQLHFLAGQTRRSAAGTAEQAAAFQRWADTCAIDWTVESRAQSLPHPPKPPEPAEVCQTGHAKHAGELAVRSFASGSSGQSRMLSC
jgi:hypothetical protein